MRKTRSDIPPIHEWRKGALGSNARERRQDHLVLLLRGELLRRYPGVVIYAVKAVVRDGQRMLATDSPAGRHAAAREPSALPRHARRGRDVRRLRPDA